MNPLNCAAFLNLRHDHGRLHIPAFLLDHQGVNELSHRTEIPSEATLRYPQQERNRSRDQRVRARKQTSRKAALKAYSTQLQGL